jgi:transposase
LGQHYLCPLAQKGETAKEMVGWIEAANTGTHLLQPIYVENEKGERRLFAEGYGFERRMRAEVEVDAEHPKEVVVWTERVFVVRSESYRQTLQKGLEERLQRATDKLLALTPPSARGKRQFEDEAKLVSAAEAILKAQDVEGLLTYTFARQEKHQTRQIGRGRGSAERPTHEIITVRYQMTAIFRQEQAITELRKTLGWRAYVSDAPAEQLTLEQAVLTYRNEWLVEHGFHRLKGVPLSLNPLFVQRDDQVAGLTNLLSLAVRILTLIEFVVRRNLKCTQEKLTGLIENNPKKGVDNPTTERLLKQFDNIFLSIVHLPDQVIRHVTPLTNLQVRILELLGLSIETYTRLADN